MKIMCPLELTVTPDGEKFWMARERFPGGMLARPRGWRSPKNGPLAIVVVDGESLKVWVTKKDYIDAEIGPVVK